MADGRRLLTVCSKIPGLPAALQTLLPGLQVESVDSPLDPGIVDATDFLVAEHNFLGPVLDCPPSGRRLRWAQNTWAGVDSLARMVEEREKLPSLKLARFSHPAFSQLMAEYCLVSVIAMERNFPVAARAQAARSWDSGTELRDYRNLGELTVAVLGVGQMGSATAKIFKSLGSRVVGFVRSSRPPDSIVDRFFTREELPELLSSVDYILAMLPATPETDGLLGGDLLASCKGAGLVSLGRGNICTEEQVRPLKVLRMTSSLQIVRAMDNGWLRGAALDVFPEEPLQPQSALWNHPKVVGKLSFSSLQNVFSLQSCLFFINSTVPLSFPFSHIPQ